MAPAATGAKKQKKKWSKGKGEFTHFSPVLVRFIEIRLVLARGSPVLEEGGGLGAKPND
jgi:hypothetical protein